ncbi:uncharacterized protein LOC143662270 isoform X2 [Tamandua tetradactyla]
MIPPLKLLVFTTRGQHLHGNISSKLCSSLYIHSGLVCPFDGDVVLDIILATCMVRELNPGLPHGRAQVASDLQKIFRPAGDIIPLAQLCFGPTWTSVL